MFDNPKPWNDHVIALEGIDGCGKTAQCQLLTDFLLDHGYEAQTFSEKIALDHLDFFMTSRNKLTTDISFVMARTYLYESHIIPYVGKGGIAILDRSFLSTYAYSMSAPRGEDDVATTRKYAEFIMYSNEHCDIFPLHIMLDVGVDVCLQRLADRPGKTHAWDNDSSDVYSLRRERFLHAINHSPGNPGVWWQKVQGCAGRPSGHAKGCFGKDCKNNLGIPIVSKA